MKHDDAPQVLSDYLDRLDAATADLPPEIRDDLLVEVRGHLDEVVGRADTEAEIRQALDRLGSPEAIAAEAREAAPPAPVVPTTQPRTSRRGFDVTALVVLVLGPAALTVLFGWFGTALGWAIGLGMLWTSRSWTSGEKLLGSLVWPGGIITPLLVFGMATQVCTSVIDDSGVSSEEVCTGFAMEPWYGIPVSIVVTLAPLVVAVFLLRRADQRR